MPQFKFKNLPNGFEFPFTRREIREFVKTTPANFEMVEFDGISFAESYFCKKFQSHSIPACYIRARYQESGWCFRLEVKGIRFERYEGRREEIANALLSEITKWADSKISLPEMAPKKACRASVRFDLTREADDIAQLSEWHSSLD